MAAVGIPVDPMKTVQQGMWNSNPTGCYWNVPNGPAAIYFNTGGNPLLEDIQRRVVCQVKPQPAPGKRPCCIPVSNLTVANVFSNDMIMQRGGKGSSVFGTAPASATIVVTVDGSEPIRAIAGPDPWNATAETIPNGWVVDLPPHPASKNTEMHTIKIECTEGCSSATEQANSVILERVKFGDVILCAGQSNMELILGVTFSWYGEYEATDQWSNGKNISNDTAYPIHFAHLDHNLQLHPSDSPTLPWIEASPGMMQAWSVPSVVGWEGLRGFSGACWYTGRALYNLRAGTADEGVPIGLIEAAWVSSWSAN
jgi:hypothetical protein